MTILKFIPMFFWIVDFWATFKSSVVANFSRKINYFILKILGIEGKSRREFYTCFNIDYTTRPKRPTIRRKDSIELMEGTQQSENGREAEIIKIYGSEILEIIILHF